MKPNILTKTIAALLLALPFAQAEEKKAVEKKEEHTDGTTNSSSTVVTSADGTATVTIDINGKKETRTFKLGDGNNTFTFGKEGDGAKAEGVVGFGGGIAGVAPGQPHIMKREKGPWIGIAMEPVQDVVRAQLSLAPGEGIVIGHVALESPAAKAGLQPNDILLRFEDQILVEPGQLRKLIAMKKPGDTVKLTVLRKGERKDANVSLIEHEIEHGEHGPMQWLQMGPGPQGWQIAPGANPGARVHEFMKELKEKRPGVIVDKRSWTTGDPSEAVKGQLEKLLRSLDDAKVPKEQLEHLRKELERAKHEVEELLENAKRNPENKPAKPHEKEKGEEKKKQPEPL
ncbi:MAG: PDZ domain-containing protein [Verrucomicrobia bacterium]|nr:PDZ domain-containing protein [Verrucomicrobiota bacterium]